MYFTHFISFPRTAVRRWQCSQFLSALQLLMVTSLRWTKQLPVLSAFQTNRITIPISLPPNVKHVFLCASFNDTTFSPARTAFSAWRPATGWGVGGSYSARGKRSHLRNHPQKFAVPPTFLFLRYRGSYPGTKRSGRDVLPATNAKVQKEWTDNFVSLYCQ
jgi:hypothetical protein